MSLPASFILESNCCRRFWEFLLCLLRRAVLVLLGRGGSTLVIGTLSSHQELSEYL